MRRTFASLSLVALVACSTASDGLSSTILPRSDGGASSDSAAADSATTSDASDAGFPVGHPNEPPGFSPFAASPCDQLPPVVAGPVSGWIGRWSRASGTNLTLDSDPTAPRSAPGVLKTRFPQTLTGGSAPARFGGWDIAGNAIEGRKTEVYWHAFIKIADSGGGYENASGSGTKLGWFGYGEDPGIGGNQSYPILTAPLNAPRLDTQFKVAFNMVGQTITANVDPSFSVTTGAWHSWEVVLRINDVGQANGVLRMWWDGKLTTDRNDLTYRDLTHPNAFFDWAWSPTYGGGPTTKTRDDFMMFDDIYMSGVAGQ